LRWIVFHRRRCAGPAQQIERAGSRREQAGNLAVGVADVAGSDQQGRKALVRVAKPVEQHEASSVDGAPLQNRIAVMPIPGLIQQMAAVRSFAFGATLPQTGPPHKFGIAACIGRQRAVGNRCRAASAGGWRGRVENSCFRLSESAASRASRQPRGRRVMKRVLLVALANHPAGAAPFRRIAVEQPVIRFAR
jgi:hypothetical protein